uniref:Uncharacterized protein n=1 Tax=Lotharella oceanica TaxID=641309 RepID=A0A7S2TEI8_9EUKA|mmetsp:Transcript_10344/g.19836  ORF Transcript_10344/g.19836 Transcript_10344/m.19836 type:complete len:291 (+) Transcript_10344:176-1048(+)|eukprot:CAMPEP_0170170282 /NCGR_PEP_ID=MMETSP0040_2-20121228/3249_1 /TAXON_ID=641309 /ORGANISM="Lotharella oceanica, Strain CCMP622" /LENGTH=290 /DNA_ID=CAMNT_0010409577 /DNA_START=102 /DNA_END=974 /DNA_ORIENTATION=-
MSESASTLLQYFKGISGAIRGAIFALGLKPIRAKAYQGLTRCVVAGVILNLAAASCIFPIVVISKGLAGLTGWDCALSFWEACFKFLKFSSWIIPTIGLFIIRNVSPSKSFTIALKTLDSELAERIEKAKPENACVSMRGLAIRIVKQVGILIAINLLCLVPVVGRFVMPAAIYFRMARPEALKLSVANVIFFIVCFGMPLEWAKWLLSLQSAALCLGYELLAPYVAKRKAIAKMNDDDDDRVGDVLNQKQPAVMAFAAPWMLVLSIPIFGMCAWEVMEGAAAYFLVNLE